VRSGRIVFADSQTVWVTGQAPGNLAAPFNLLFRTTNAGASRRTTKLRFDASNYLLDPISGTTAFAASTDYLAHTILVTRNGGRTWKTAVTVWCRRNASSRW
jgi:photosystem II stability/assembly factor-like uncharacterized protein